MRRALDQHGVLRAVLVDLIGVEMQINVKRYLVAMCVTMIANSTSLGRHLSVELSWLHILRMRLEKNQ